MNKFAYRRAHPGRFSSVHRWLSAWKLLAATVCWCAATSAQHLTGEIAGLVTDPSGAVVPNARVVAENLETGEIRSSETNEAGQYVLGLLRIGRYRVRVEKEGFQSFVAGNLLLNVGQRLRVDAALAIGAVTEEVAVTAQPAGMQTDSATIRATVSESAVQDFPTGTRNFISLALLTPGAHAGSHMGINSGQRGSDRRPTNSIAVNGQSDMMNRHMLDGLDNTIRDTGAIAVRPSVEAIAEVQVQTNVYTAEVVSTAGGVITVLTKSGGNRLRGTLCEYLRNDLTDARDFFMLGAPKMRQHQFGGALGGPIRRNRLFFFADAEGFRQIQSTVNTFTVPTEYQRAHPGDFSDIGGPVIAPSRISPIGLALFRMYPPPNRPGVVNNYTASPNRTQQTVTADGRVDWNISDRQWFFWRYSFNDTETFNPGFLPKVDGIEPGGNIFGFQGRVKQRPQNLQFNFVRVLRPNWLVEAKAGATRYSGWARPLNYGTNASERLGIPGVNVSDTTTGLVSLYVIGYAGLGDSLWMLNQRAYNTFQYSGSVAYTTGRHSVKFGSLLIRRQMNLFFAESPVGWFIFAPLNLPPLSTTNAAANLLLGMPARVERALLLGGTRGFRSWEWGVFVQDDWRAARWLTLNLGLRYDVWPPATEVAHRMVNFDLVAARLRPASSSDPSAGLRTFYGNLAPRFGFAASLPRSFVLRGGYGLSFFPAVFFGTELQNIPLRYYFGPVSFRPLAQGLPPLVALDPQNPSGTIQGLAFDLRTAYLQQFNLTLQKSLGANVLTASYVGQLGRQLSYGPDVDFNLPDPSPLPNPMSRAPYAAVLPNATQIKMHFNGGTSHYHAFQASLQRHLSRGLGLNVNYTWSHAIDNVQNGSVPTITYGHRPRALKQTEKASSDLDVRHRFVFSAIYQIPGPAAAKGVWGFLARGWQLNSISSWQTGLPFTVSNANPQSNLGPALLFTGDRPNRTGSGWLARPTLGRWFDTSAFVPQPFGTLGNSGRNILRAPRIMRIDLSLFKEFAPHEELRIQFRVESYNVTNTPSFAPPNAQMGSPGYGAISSTLPTVGPRMFQFALKALF